MDGKSLQPHTATSHHTGMETNFHHKDKQYEWREGRGQSILFSPHTTNYATTAQHILAQDPIS